MLPIYNWPISKYNKNPDISSSRNIIKHILFSWVLKRFILDIYNISYLGVYKGGNNRNVSNVDIHSLAKTYHLKLRLNLWLEHSGSLQDLLSLFLILGPVFITLRYLYNQCIQSSSGIHRLLKRFRLPA